MMTLSRAALRRTAAILTALAILAAPVGIARAGDDALAEARGATARYHSLRQAERAGYALPPAGVPLHECIAAPDGSGAMGYHYVNGGLLDAALDPSQPEVLVYGDPIGGKPELVALEYVVFQADWEAEHGTGAVPRLFGRELTLVGAGNRYELPPFFQIHAWVWEPNPAGTFEDFNPEVSCG